MAYVAVRACYLLCLVLIVTYSDLTIAQAQAVQHPAPDFTKHTLIKPRIYHGREKRQISSTREKEKTGEHAHHLEIHYDHGGVTRILDLKLNRDLVAKNFFHRVQVNGTDVVKKPSAEDVELCHYNGKIRGVPDSFVAVSTCEGLEGVIRDGDDTRYVAPAGNGIGGYHFLYSHSDLAERNKTCGYNGGVDDEQFNKKQNEFNRILRYKREEPSSKIKGPYNANKQSRYIELVLVIDNTLYKELGEKSSRVEKYCKDITNIINALYTPLNIFIALVGVVTWTEYDVINLDPDGDTTLTNFLHYRRETLIKSHPNDNAQLITKMSFNNGVVGKALKGPICTYEYSGAVNSNHSPVIGLVAATIAHEMGHNFGMEHDTNECGCPDERCIMAPSSSTVPPKHWSTCSLDYLALSFEHGMDYCLRNKPESLFGSPVCGNGFVEPGEQCDCGLPEHCDNTCCNPVTCMLNANATCATGECCDLTTCNHKKAGTLCRSADLECDLPEYCTGLSEYCPADFYKIDTEPCNDGKAYCYHGSCRTRSDQCKLLWGITGKSSDDECYRQNKKGIRQGNCGYNKLTQSYAKCEDENVLCGMLHCQHLNERLEFGMESVAILSQSFINKGGLVISCRTALVDLGLNQIDPGLAPDGAKCGDEKMCVNQTCQHVGALRSAGPKRNDCNGNGVWNNLGHCHCKEGYEPPNCNYPGVGGSIDSGPAADPNVHKTFVVAVLIIFLVVIPVLALLFVLVFYIKHNLKFRWTKPPVINKSPAKPSTRGSPYQPDTLKRPSEDNHSLLSSEEPLKNEFFGHFKGFTISTKKTEPSRPAPPVPTTPIAPPFKSPSFNRTTKPAAASPKLAPIGFETVNVAPAASSALPPIGFEAVAPALPPLNPGSTARPIISSPILENSTCTAKELISPLRNAPKVPARPAPSAPGPQAPKERPLSADVAPVVTFNLDEKKLNGSALNRIASFLKPNEKRPLNTNSLPRNKKIDKNILRTLEISNPIPQTEIKADNLLPAGEASRQVVMRAQSMRQKEPTARPAIPSFGSMRQPDFKRPVSIPSATRPKSPPPPRPPLPEINDKNKNFIKIPGLPGYQEPYTDNKEKNQYDDCLNRKSNAKSPSSDNIYSVIDEPPAKSPETQLPTAKSHLNVPSNSGSSESFGLLGEIVSEIQNRNFDSIYSTSTLKKKKQQQQEEEDKRYINTSPAYKSPSESVYSNMNNFKSSASSTSSGYIHPSAVNAPVKQQLKNNENKSQEKPPPMSTFKGNNSKKTEQDNKIETNKIENNKIRDNNKTIALDNNKTSDGDKTKKFDRQITPPNLKARRPSPSRTPPGQTLKNRPKPTSNSPDLVTSCSTNKKPSGAQGPKPPDVLNNSVKKPVTSAKPNLPKTVPKLTKSVSLNNKEATLINKEANLNTKDINLNNKEVKIDKPTAKITKANSDCKVMPTGARLAAKQNSTVASLQQKFENKPPISAKNVKK